ncbi:MAG: phosphotransferase [Spirochaetales bacterium]|nr:phosphotransferase [Spirochaetales bacterium]
MKTQFEGKFHDLPFPEKVKHLTGVGHRALACWDYPEDSQMKLLNYTENASFLVQAAGRPKMIMRVHRLDYATHNSISTELKWIMDLKAETDIRLASPIESVNGSLIECIETPDFEEKRFVVCFEFLDGKAPVDSSDSNEDVGDLISKIEKIPDKITVPLFKFASVMFHKLGKLNSKSAMSGDDRQLYRSLGEIAAKIRCQSEEWTLPSYYERMSWDFDGTFGEEWNNFYGESYRAEDWFSARDIKILDQSVELMKTRLEAYGKDPSRYGMIHSDLRTSNLLCSEEGVAAIDFDDCGQGWYMYEIAGIVALIEHRADLDEIVDEIITGYESIKSISNEDKEEIGTFIMMRRLGMLESILCRIGCVFAGEGESVDLTSEIIAFYAKGCVLLAKDYIKKYQNKPMPVPVQSFTDKVSIA